MEQERPIEAVAIASQPSNLLVFGVEHIEAILKFVLSILLLEDTQILKLADVRAAFCDFLFELVLILCAEFHHSTLLVELFLSFF